MSCVATAKINYGIGVGRSGIAYPEIDNKIASAEREVGTTIQREVIAVAIEQGRSAAEYGLSGINLDVAVRREDVVGATAVGECRQTICAVRVDEEFGEVVGVGLLREGEPH